MPTLLRYRLLQGLCFSMTFAAPLFGADSPAAGAGSSSRLSSAAPGVEERKDDDLTPADVSDPAATIESEQAANRALGEAVRAARARRGSDGGNAASARVSTITDSSAEVQVTAAAQSTPQVPSAGHSAALAEPGVPASEPAAEDGVRAPIASQMVQLRQSSLQELLRSADELKRRVAQEQQSGVGAHFSDDGRVCIVRGVVPEKHNYCASFFHLLSDILALRNDTCSPATLAHIEMLIIMDTTIAVILQGFLDGFENLKALVLENNTMLRKIGDGAFSIDLDESIEGFGRLPILEYLSISGSRYLQSIGRGFTENGMPKLEHFAIIECGITHMPSPDYVPNLVTLEITRNSQLKKMPAIAHLKHLRLLRCLGNSALDSELNKDHVPNIVHNEPLTLWYGGNGRLVRTSQGFSKEIKNLIANNKKVFVDFTCSGVATGEALIDLLRHADPSIAEDQARLTEITGTNCDDHLNREKVTRKLQRKAFYPLRRHRRVTGALTGPTFAPGWLNSAESRVKGWNARQASALREWTVQKIDDQKLRARLSSMLENRESASVSSGKVDATILLLRHRYKIGMAVTAGKLLYDLFSLSTGGVGIAVRELVSYKGRQMLLDTLVTEVCGKLDGLIEEISRGTVSALDTILPHGSVTPVMKIVLARFVKIAGPLAKEFREKGTVTPEVFLEQLRKQVGVLLPEERQALMKAVVCLLVGVGISEAIARGFAGLLGNGLYIETAQGMFDMDPRRFSVSIFGQTLMSSQFASLYDASQCVYALRFATGVALATLCAFDELAQAIIDAGDGAMLYNSKYFIPVAERIRTCTYGMINCTSCGELVHVLRGIAELGQAGVMRVASVEASLPGAYDRRSVDVEMSIYKRQCAEMGVSSAEREALTAGLTALRTVFEGASYLVSGSEEDARAFRNSVRENRVLRTALEDMVATISTRDSAGAGVPASCGDAAEQRAINEHIVHVRAMAEHLLGRIAS